MRRTKSGTTPLSKKTLSADDVNGLLSGSSAFISEEQAVELKHSGTINANIPDVGRCRISYISQRGSRAFRIVRIPFALPTVQSSCADPVQAMSLIESIRNHEYKTVIIYGPSMVNNSTLAYSLLGEMNHVGCGVIYITERLLSFLLKHDQSIVVGVEAGTDVPTLEDAIQQALLLEPNVVFIGDLHQTDELPSLPQLISSDMCTLISTVTEDPEVAMELLPKTVRESLTENKKGVLLHVDTNGKRKLVLTPTLLN